MSRELPLIIVNPAARGGAAGRDWAGFAVTIRAHFAPFDCTFTQEPGDATRIAREEAGAGRRFLIAFGGDGTVSEVAAGILHSGATAELGLLPYGSGADFIRSLGLPKRLADAARALRNGRSCLIDVGRVTYRTADGREASRYFVNSASFGMSGLVAERTNRSSKRFGGKIAFAGATLKTAFSFRPPEVALALDGQPSERRRIAQVAVCNGRYFGGGMKIAPEARLVDGRLDVIVIDKLSVLDVVVKSPRLYAGTHLNLKEVHQAQVQSMTAEPTDAQEAVFLEVDGETPGRLPARFEVCPEALRLRAPAPK